MDIAGTCAGEFLIDVAQSGQEALGLIESQGPYAVVISDMSMPGMDGIGLLRRVKSTAPETARVMLTGNADMDTAVQAINEGSIFRFLNKTCDKEIMAKAITTALVQYRLITAEKQLLEQTPSRCLQVLSEVLSLVNPRGVRQSRESPPLYPPCGDGDEVGKYLAI
jgi:DNA-binding NtrC family response regulator